MIRHPALLSADMTESTRLDPTAMSVTLNMVGASEASISLPDDAPEVRIHDWISIYTGRGFCGVFRVSNIANGLRRQTDLTLLHGRDILADSAWAAQLEFEGTKAEYLAALLNQQTHLLNGVKPWVLGTCADTSTIKKSINYDRLSNLLEDLEEDGSDYYFTYDQTVFPWVINYVAKDQTVTSEFRLTRNVHAATVTYNDADLCTRLHLSINVKVEDEDTSTHSTDTIIKTYDSAAAQAEWGVVVKTADIDTGDDLSVDPPLTPEADAWAANFLARRAEPSVQIQIDGEELKALTGEDWDEVDIGRLCQVALPAYRRSFQERVVSIVYDFSIDSGQIAPEGVNVSLANALPKFSETIAQIRDEADKAARAARGGGRGAASAEELKVWSKHVWYQGQALDGTGIITLYESGIDMDAAGGVTIFSLEQGVQALYSSIQTNAHEITLKVSNGNVKTQLAIECGNVTISGGNLLVIDGMITASNLASELANIDAIEVQDIAGGNAEFTRVDSTTLYADTLNGDDLNNFIVNASVDQNTNTLTLTKGNGQTINFSKAAAPENGTITSIVQSAAATYSSAGTYGTYTVHARASGTNLTNAGNQYDQDLIVVPIAAYQAGEASTTAYQDGMAAGEAKFVQATVTPQGASAGTVYLRKTGGSIRVGSSTTIHQRGTAIYFKSHPKSETPTSLWYSMVGSASEATQTYYTSGSDITAYPYSSSGTYYYLGDGSRTDLFLAGTPDTTTYYTKTSS